MSWLYSILTSPEGQRFGWTLIHFLWQGTIVGVGLALVMAFVRSAERRYAVACGALLLMILLPIGTYLAETSARPTAEIHVAVARLESLRSAAPAASIGQPAGPSPMREAVAAMSRILPPDHLGIMLRGALPWIVITWSVGVLLLGLRLICGGGLVLRLQRSAKRPEDGGPRLLVDRLAQQMGIPHPVRLAASIRVAAPMVAGIFRPVILIPMNALTGLTPRQLEMILAHELAHIRRKDALVNLLQSTIETLLFYHPAVWYVSRKIRFERENCCDDAAVAICGDRLDYARALVGMEELRASQAPFALAARGGSLQQRIRRVLADPAPSSHRTASPLAGAIALGCLLILMGAMDLLPSRGADLPTPMTWDAYASLVSQALAEGDDARALDFSCRQPAMNAWGEGRMAKQMALSLDIDDAMYRRYSAGFRPPDNIEELIPMWRWDRAGCSFSFSLGKGSTLSLKRAGVRETIYYQTGSRPDSAYVVIRDVPGAISLTLDLDLDGRSELEFDGRDARVADRLSVAIDHAADGRRTQWLLAMPGEDPRRAARFMLYRDGDFFLFLLDSDGDGKGDFGRSRSVAG